MAREPMPVKRRLAVGVSGSSDDLSPAAVAAATDGQVGMSSGPGKSVPADPTAYTGGTYTAPYAPPATVGLRQAEDFSSAALMRKRNVAYQSTYGRAQELRQGPVAAPPAPAPWGRGPAAPPPVPADWADRQRLVEAARLEAEWTSGNQHVPLTNAALNAVVVEARAAGVNLTPQDVSNLTNVGDLNRAATMFNERMNQGDIPGARNVLITMQAKDPVMASMIPAWAEELATKAATAVSTDAEWLTKSLTWAGDQALTNPASPLKVMMDEWETAQHVWRAGMAPSSLGENPEFSWIQAALDPLTYWAATEPGMFDPNKINDLKTEYPPALVDTAVALSKGAADGDGNVMLDILETSTDPAVISFIRDVMIPGEPTGDVDAVELMRKVDEANMGGMGPMTMRMFGDLGAGTQAREIATDIASVGTSFADPLIIVPGVVRSMMAVKYAITKLAPKAGRAGVEAALASRTIAGVEQNRARRFFEAFLREADRMDELGGKSWQEWKAGPQRQRIARQFKELPDDVAQRFLDMTRPRAGILIDGKRAGRSMNGVVVDNKQVSKGLIDLIAEDNDAWQVMAGKVSESATKRARDYLINKAIVAKIVETTDPDELLAAMKAGDVPQDIIDKTRGAMEGMVRRETDQPIYARIADKQHRDLLMPRTGLIADLRRRAVNGIIVDLMPDARTAAWVDAILHNAATPFDVSVALDSSVEGAAKASRQVFGGELKGRPGAALDRVTGLLSTMPNSLFIDIKNGSNAIDFYKYTRQFFSKDASAILTDAFRTGTSKDRRLIVAGVVRSGAMAKGVNLSKKDVLDYIDDLVTGSREGEMYGLATPGQPSTIMVQSTMRNAETALGRIEGWDEAIAKSEAAIVKAQAKLAKAEESGNAGAAQSARNSIASHKGKIAKRQVDIGRANKDVDKFRAALIRSLGRKVESRPSEGMAALPAERVESLKAPVKAPTPVAPAPLGPTVGRDGAVVETVATPPLSTTPEGTWPTSGRGQQAALDVEGMPSVDPNPLTGAVNDVLPVGDVAPVAPKTVTAEDSAAAAKVARDTMETRHVTNQKLLPKSMEFVGQNVTYAETTAKSGAKVRLMRMEDGRWQAYIWRKGKTPGFNTDVDIHWRATGLKSGEGSAIPMGDRAENDALYTLLSQELKDGVDTLAAKFGIDVDRAWAGHTPAGDIQDVIVRDNGRVEVAGKRAAAARITPEERAFAETERVITPTTPLPETIQRNPMNSEGRQVEQTLPSLTEKTPDGSFWIQQNENGGYSAHAVAKGKKTNVAVGDITLMWQKTGLNQGGGSSMMNRPAEEKLRAGLQDFVDRTTETYGIDLDRPWAAYTPAADQLRIQNVLDAAARYDPEVIAREAALDAAEEAADAAALAAQNEIRVTLTAAELSDRIPDLTAYQDADALLSELADDYARVMAGGGLADQAEFDARMLQLEADWARDALDDPVIYEAWMDSLGLSGKTPPKDWAATMGKAFDDGSEDFNAGADMGNRTVGGSQDTGVDDVLFGNPKSAGAKRWKADGTITRSKLVEMRGEMDEEELWAWWNTGNADAYMNDGFFAKYGPSVEWKTDPDGKLIIPGEYLQEAVDAKGLKGAVLLVPWKGQTGTTAREAYIQGSWENAAYEFYNKAVTGRDSEPFTKWVAGLREQAAPKVDDVVDAVPDGALNPARVITTTPADAPIQTWAPAPLTTGTKKAIADSQVAINREMSLSHLLPMDDSTPVMRAYTQAEEEFLTKYRAKEITWGEKGDWTKTRATEIYVTIRESAPIPQERAYWKSIGVDDGGARGAKRAIAKTNDDYTATLAVEAERATERAAAEAADPILVLRRLAEHGPTYNRGVAENLGKYDRMIAEGRTDEAAHWLSEAQKDAARAEAQRLAAAAKNTGATMAATDGIPPFQEGSARDLIEEWRARGMDPTAPEGPMWSPSVDKFGHEHAISLYQTSDWVVVPHMGQIEAIHRFQQMKVGNLVGTGMQASTDIWSLGTLVGYRFAVRSSVEDMISYMVTGGLGHLGDLQRGRRASTAMREARPSERLVTQGHGKNKTTVAVQKSRLGLVAKRSRAVSDWVARGNLTSIQQWWLGRIDPAATARAADAAKTGNYRPLKELTGESLARMHFKGMSDEEIGWIKDLSGTRWGNTNMENFAETAAAQFKGSRPKMAGGDDLRDIPDVEFVKPGIPVYFGDYKAVGLSAANDRSPYGTWFWHRKLQAFIEDDGPIGKLAVLHLHDPSKAKKAIADAIRKDKQFGYKDRYSLIGNDAAIDSFASGYYETVLTYFLKKDGTINERLRAKFITKHTDAKGNEHVWAQWTVTDDKGRNRPILSSQALGEEFTGSQRPQYVLGREVLDIPMASNEKALWTDRVWDWMGNQYARLAREPIFLANYMMNRRALAASEKTMAQSIADRAGRNVLESDRFLAKTVADRMAQDQAYAFSLAYMDNPNNRSVLAWKVRNVSRYYRATEDFYRRAERLTKNYPDAWWKMALTYQVLDDTGFTYRDANNDLYFAYPANGFLQDALATVSSVFPGGVGWGFGTAVDPFIIGGKLKNVSPSTDPQQQLPTIAGPIASIGLVTLFNMFPTMQGLKTLTLGGYSNAGQTGDLMAELWAAVMPAGVKRFWTALDPAEQESSIASSTAAALAIMIANGTIEVDPANPMTIEQLKKNDVYAQAQAAAIAVQLTKTAFGFVAPASPQMYQNTINEYGRDMGFPGVSSVWKALMDKHDGDWAAAFVDWQKIDPDGALLPFIQSRTKDNPDMLAGLTKAKPYQSVIDFTRLPGVADLAKRFPDSYLFLAPQEGEFTWGGWAMLKAFGLKVDKTEDDLIIDYMAAKGEQADSGVRTMFADLIASEDTGTVEGRKAISALEAQQTEARQNIERGNPYWSAKRASIRTPYQVNRIRDQYTQTSAMVAYIRERDGTLTGTALGIEQANSVYLQMNIIKAGYSANTEAGKTERRTLDATLTQALTALGQRDPAVASYIDMILTNLKFGDIT